MKEIVLSSSVLILVITLLRQGLRGRIDPRVQYAVWLLVAVRLLVPGTFFSAPVSVAGATAELETIFQERAQTPVFNAQNPPPAPTAGHAEMHLDNSTAHASRNGWLGTVWRVGMGVTGAALVLSNLSFYLTLRRRRKKADVSCGTLRVYVAKGLTSPCLFGVFRPAVYLTPDALENGCLDYVLAHEYTHFRHGDHLWALLRSVCLTVHWYNPLVWLAAALSRRDCELACDAGAIRRLGEERRLDYGEALLRMVTAGRSGLLCTATTMSIGKQTMKERVSLIANRPRMLKVTLALVVLVVCALMVLAFGGAGENAEPDKPQDVSGTELDDFESTIPTITEAEALSLYAKAREAWDWFELGTMPLANEAYTEDGSLFYYRMEDFEDEKSLKSYLESIFTQEIVEYLLGLSGPFPEHNGGLYMQLVGRGSSIYAGQELVLAFVQSPEEVEQYGYSAHILARTEVLDEDLTTVMGYKRHDFFCVWNGENFVFSSFGPWDDVAPELYYNAKEIRARMKAGAAVEDWLPLMSYMDWTTMMPALIDSFDLALEVVAYINSFVRERGMEMTMAQYLYILSATEGLDGAYAETFQSIVYDLYAANPPQFAYVVLEQLPDIQRDAVIDFFRYEQSFRREDGEVLSVEDTIAQLEDAEESLMTNSFPGLLPAATLTSAGSTFRFPAANTYGIYAATYASADPDVAVVDENGTVTAVGVGETTITMHYEGAGGVHDFSCEVVCQW